MKSKRFSRNSILLIVFVFIMAAAFLCAEAEAAKAKYVIYFKSGKKRVVRAYRQEGNSISIYYRGGWVQFPRSSISSIKKVEEAPSEEKRRADDTKRRLKEHEERLKAEAEANREPLAPAPLEGTREISTLIYGSPENQDEEWVEVAEDVFIRPGVYTPGSKVEMKLITHGGMQKKILKVSVVFDHNVIPAKTLYQAVKPSWYEKIVPPTEDELLDADMNAGYDEAICNFKIPEDIEPRNLEGIVFVDNLVAVYLVGDISYLQGEKEKEWTLKIAYPSEKDSAMATIETHKEERRAEKLKKTIFTGVGVLVIIAVLVGLILILIPKLVSQRKLKASRQASLKAARKSPEELIREFDDNNLFAVMGEDEKLLAQLNKMGRNDSLTALKGAISNKDLNVQTRSSLAKMIGKLGGEDAYDFLFEIISRDEPDEDTFKVMPGAILGLGLIKDERCVERLLDLANWENQRIANFAKKALLNFEQGEEN